MAAQIIAILRQAEGGVPVAGLWRAHGISGFAEGSSWEKVDGSSQRREMAENAVARRGASISPFGVSETCRRYGPKLRAEDEAIADLLTGLTDARKTWGFGLCFLHLRNVMGHPWNCKRVYRIYCELEPPVSGKLSAALLFLYFSGGRVRTMTWDIHRNENRLC